MNPELQKKFDIANQLFKEKKYQDSAKKYEDILKQNPNSISIKNNLALCYEGLREFKKAINLYKNCIDAKPDPLFFNNIGRVYFTVKDYKNSCMYLEKSLSMNNKQIYIIELLTASYNHLNLSDKIIKLLENLINSFPKNRFLNGCFGKNLLKANRHAEGLYYLRLGYGMVELNENKDIKIIA